MNVHVPGQDISVRPCCLFSDNVNHAPSGFFFVGRRVIRGFFPSSRRSLRLRSSAGTRRIDSWSGAEKGGNGSGEKGTG